MAFDLIAQLTQESSIFLFVLVVVVLVIAFKILKIFFETLFVAILSGVFYLILASSGVPLDTNAANVLLFSFLGSIIFLVYTFVAPFVGLAARMIRGTGRAIKIPRKGKKVSARGKSKEKQVILREVNEIKDDDEEEFRFGE